MRRAVVESPQAIRTIGLAVADGAANEKRRQINGRRRDRDIGNLK